MSDLIEWAYFDGHFVPRMEARLPLHDAGFVFGATMTDLCRTVRHRLYRWQDHLDRFRRSCRAARIGLPLTEDDQSHAAEELTERNAKLLRPEQELALVMLATPGPVGYYAGQSGGAGEAAVTFIMHTFPLPFVRYRHLLREGARLVVPSIRHVPAVCVDPRLKQRSRLHWWLAEQEAHLSDPGAMALLLDTEGHVTETAGANFLIVRDGSVLSPPRDSILAGVSLQVVRELCGELGIPFAEQRLNVYDCLNADEALLTSTPYCLAGVNRINGVPIPWPGPVCGRLLAAWSQKIGLDVAAQIEAAVS